MNPQVLALPRGVGNASSVGVGVSAPALGQLNVLHELPEFHKESKVGPGLNLPWTLWTGFWLKQCSADVEMPIFKLLEFESCMLNDTPRPSCAKNVTFWIQGRFLAGLQLQTLVDMRNMAVDQSPGCRGAPPPPLSLCYKPLSRALCSKRLSRTSV